MSDKASAKPRKKRRRIAPFLLLGAVIALAAAGPTIIANTPARDAALATLLPPEVGSLTATGGVFGWTGPTALTGVEVRDAQGDLLLTTQRLELSGSLLDLAMAPNGKLDIQVEKPVLSINFDPAGSNLERFLEALEASRNQQDQDGTDEVEEQKNRAISLVVNDAELRITDHATGERWLGSDVKLSASGLKQGFAALEAQAEGKIGLYLPPEEAAAAPPQGTFSFRIGKAEDGRRLAALNLDASPLSLAGPILRRSDPNARIAGWIGAEGQAAWPPGLAAEDLLTALFAEGFSSSGQTTLADFAYQGALTGGEPLRVPRFDSPWSIGAAGGRLTITRLRVGSDLGSVEAQGAISMQEALAWRGGARTLPANLIVNGELDMAQLARLSPEALRLRQGVQIDSGRVQADLTSSVANGVPRLTGYVRTENLAGVSQGRAVSWEDPLEMTFTATQTSHEKWRLDNLRCQSDFLVAQASGDAAGVRGDGNFDLDRLSAELRKFVDLGDWRLTGQGESNFEWRYGPAQQAWAATATGQMTNLAIGPGATPLVSERRLDFTGSAAGTGADLASLTSADITLTVGEDLLKVILDEQPGESSPFSFELQGDLASWISRVRMTRPTQPLLAGYTFAGRIDANGAGALEDKVLQVTNFTATASDLGVNSAAGLRLREPFVQLEGDFAWNAETGVAASEETKLVASALTWATREVILSPTGPPEASRGEAVFRGDLARLVEWFPPAAPGPRWKAQGTFAGRVSLRGEQNGAPSHWRLPG